MGSGIQRQVNDDDVATLEELAASWRDECDHVARAVGDLLPEKIRLKRVVQRLHEIRDQLWRLSDYIESNEVVP